MAALHFQFQLVTHRSQCMAVSGFANIQRLCPGQHPWILISSDVGGVAQTFDTEHVQYVYPAKLQNFLRQQFLLVRLRAIGASIAAACFAVLQMVVHQSEQ